MGITMQSSIQHIFSKTTNLQEMPKHFALFPSATLAIFITQPLHEFPCHFNTFVIEFTAGRK